MTAPSSTDRVRPTRSTIAARTAPSAGPTASARRRRPFVHPLRTPAGHVLTVDAPDDHPWHHGLWFTIKFVNGENFWEEYDEYGVLRHRRAARRRPRSATTTCCRSAATSTGSGPTARRSWCANSGRWTHRRSTRRRYAIDFDTTLVAHDRRRARPHAVHHVGRLRRPGRSGGDRTCATPASCSPTARPPSGSKACPSPWLDLSGVVDGATRGVTCHRRARTTPPIPCPGTASTRHDTYGPTATTGPTSSTPPSSSTRRRRSAPGEPLRFRYRIVVHDGDADPTTIEAQVADYHRELAP